MALCWLNEKYNTFCTGCIFYVNKFEWKTPPPPPHPWEVSCPVHVVPVHNTPEEFENAALFLRLGLPSTLIRHEDGVFRKRSPNSRNWKTPAFRFRVDEKHFENGAFRKRCRHDNHVISLTEISSNTNAKMTVDCCFFKLLRLSVDGEHWMRFQSEISVFVNFFRSRCGRGQRV